MKILELKKSITEIKNLRWGSQACLTKQGNKLVNWEGKSDKITQTKIQKKR